MTITATIQKICNQAIKAVQQAAHYLVNLLRSIFDTLSNASSSSYTWMTGISGTITRRPLKAATKQDLVTQGKELNQKTQDTSANVTRSHLPTFSIIQKKLSSRANLYWAALAVATTYLTARSLVSYGSNTEAKSAYNQLFLMNSTALNIAPEHAPTPAPDFETAITDSHKERFFEMLSLATDKMSQIANTLVAASCTFWVRTTMAKLQR